MQKKSQDMKKQAIVVIDSIHELQRFSEFFEMGLGQYIFRGQKRSAWNILTSLERHEEGEKCKYWGSNTGQKPGGIHLTRYLAATGCSNEYEEILRFSDTWEKDYGVRLDDLTSAALRRHFGCPSRLLDVSKSFDVALYFAYEGKNTKEDSAIWAICVDQISGRAERIFSMAKERFGDVDWENRLVKELLCSEKFYEKMPFVLPVGAMNHVPWMIAQKGMFLMPLSKCFMQSLAYTLSGHPALQVATMSAEQFLNGDQENFPLVKFVLSHQIDNEVGDLLSEKNLTKKRIFPDEKPIWVDHLKLKVTFQ